MGLLDEAIREHLELKRRRGADAGELSRARARPSGPSAARPTARPTSRRSPRRGAPSPRTRRPPTATSPAGTGQDRDPPAASTADAARPSRRRDEAAAVSHKPPPIPAAPAAADPGSRAARARLRRCRLHDAARARGVDPGFDDVGAAAAARRRRAPAGFEDLDEQPPLEKPPPAAARQAAHAPAPRRAASRRPPPDPPPRRPARPPRRRRPPRRPPHQPPPPAAVRAPAAPAAGEPAGEDLLEETPEFLEETPGPRPPVVRAAPAARLRLRQVADAAMRHPITWLDVFTSTPLTGNQLAVVHDADGIDDATMLAFARETRLLRDDVRADPDRGPAPTTATASGRCPARSASPATRRSAPRSPSPARAACSGRRYVQQTLAGKQPSTCASTATRRARRCCRSRRSFGAEPRAAASWRGRPRRRRRAPRPPAAGRLDRRRRSSWRRVRDREALERVAPTPARCARCSSRSARSCCTSSPSTPTPAPPTRAACSSASTARRGPGTGSAAGPLLAYLYDRAGTRSLTIRQGDEIGRPSRIDCSWAEDRPRVAGDVVVVADGHVSL